ncbi:hypothetical protein [Ligilactobacillus murinus]|uniref:Uncharacterized protein n=1 Tax=Ligilactobacillus murinus TaxID=1622 RepID=A0A4V1PSA9_9LACO|nr:hypothetical protein [Ligilactobacillus murinus]NBH86365.1 hypothetical protein [Lachnospiraceae bacterium]MBF0701127.1 hypothetical protein [Ligilactobacillus murinus]MCR1880808.1 hypothetical protein [Ligilactobacillus murinus]MCR1896697.1 hypothetical protein [Ligilactobacillus murinus]MCZ0674115.1 hypothetical protein [Ligilactobacillus murinus]
MKIGYTEAIHYTQKGKQIEVVNNLYRTLFLILGVIILSLPQALSNESEFLQFWDGITSGNALLIILSFFSSYGIGLLLQIGLIVIFSSIYIMRNVRLLDKEAVFLGIDEGEEGLWLQTYRYRSPIYIPFTCLEKLDFTAKKIVLSYKQAFILKGEQNGDVTVLSGKRHTFSYQGLNIADVPTFIKSCNQCLPKDKKQTFPEIVVDKSRNKMKFLFTLGLIFSMVISFNFAKDLPYLIVSKMENRTQETSALKAGTTFTTRNFKFKVKKALKANTDHDTQIGIVQFEIAPKKTDTTPIWLNQMDFSIVADKKKYQTDGKKLLEEATVVVNGQKREVVNLLDGSATFFDGEEKVVNIAFNIDQDLKEAYLVYKDWDSSIKNSIPIFIKIVPSELEDIKK